jgi:hypothetical protein
LTIQRKRDYIKSKGSKTSGSGGDKKATAINLLKQKGYPVTEGNIKAIMEQL